jgi:ABC-type sugar transport system ATPase subunit
MQTEPVLSLVGISKFYGPQAALDDVSLDVYPGSVMALLGHNGAGKSTLVKVMSGVIAPDRGEIVMGGDRSDGFTSPLQAQDHGVLAVQQDLNLVRDLTLLENWALHGHFSARRLATVSWRRELRNARASLKRVGLDDRIAPLLNRLVGELKPSQRAWATLAVTLLGRSEATAPRLLLLDEITSAVEPSESLELIAAARRGVDDAVAVVVITHDIDEALAVSDRVVVMRDGKVVADWPKEKAAGSDVVALIAGIETRSEAADPEDHRALDTEGTVCDLGVLRADGSAVEIRRGEILGVTGLPDSGAFDIPVELATRRIERSKRRALGKVGYIPGDRALGVIPGSSVTHNATIGALGRSRSSLFGKQMPFLSGKLERASARAIVRDLGVKTQSTEVEITKLSGGNQQKVLLGRWLLANSNLMVLEEPLQGLDVAAKVDFVDHIREFVRNGGAVVYVASDAVELVDSCDRVVVMNRGRVTRVLNRDALDQSDGASRIVEECYA